jgi:DNA-binding SARP family transcriptional activator
MDLRIMGNVEVHDGAAAIALVRAGERCVLASLALSPGRRIQVSTLIDRIWDSEPPINAEYTVASYARTVRRAIGQAGGQRELLSSHRPGAYELHVAPDLVDYHRFTARVAQARREHDTGHPAAAVLAYQSAVGLRRGEPLADVSGEWARNRRYAIEQEYLAALCELFEEQLAIGQFADVATRAIHTVAEVVPTDRMIVLAAYGLAGSGQHAAIPDFLAFAARRMWDATEVRPSDEAVAIAEDLVARPDAQLAWRRQSQLRSAPATDVAPLPTECDAGEPVRAPAVAMIAHHNRYAYQSAGNQYIVDTA